MPVSAQTRTRVRKFIGVTEEIRYIFPAVGAFITTGTAQFLFVVTDSAIIVVTVGYFSRNKPKGIWGTYPRRSRLGPVELRSGAIFEFRGTNFEIDDEYIAVINAADAEISARKNLPVDPLPDL